jgi:hypothetical protein
VARLLGAMHVAGWRHLLSADLGPFGPIKVWEGRKFHHAALLPGDGLIGGEVQGCGAQSACCSVMARALRALSGPGLAHRAWYALLSYPIRYRVSGGGSSLLHDCGAAASSSFSCSVFCSIGLTSVHSETMAVASRPWWCMLLGGRLRIV